MGLLAEPTRFEIPSTEHLQSDRSEFKNLIRWWPSALPEDAPCTAEIVLDKTAVTAETLEETREGLRSQIEHIEESLL